MMPDWLHRWAWASQWLDPYVQTAILIASVIGALFSAYAYWHTRQQWRLVRLVPFDPLRRSVIRLHLMMHAGICACQLILVLVSLGMLLLPPLPVAMYVSNDGAWVVVVLSGRKLGRLLTSLILGWLSVYKVHWLARTFGLRPGGRGVA